MSFTVYKSSAGSGKTYTLVKEYLKIVLLKPSSFRSVLAITFTNKAANEMKERIVGNLQELAKPEQNPNNKIVKFLLPELISETGLSETEIQTNAGKSLALILHNYSDFAISTIDSFVHKIVKTFAYDLKLPLNFDVELDADKLISEAVHSLISKVGIDKELTELLVQFTKSKADDERDWHIENDLIKLSNTLVQENGQAFVSYLSELGFDDFKKIIKSLNEFNNRFRVSINKLSKDALSLINDNHISHASFFQGKKGIVGMFSRFSYKLNDEYVIGTFARKTIEEDKWYSSKVSPEQKDAINRIKDELVQIYHSIEEVLDRDLEKFMLFSMLSKQIYPLAVLSEINQIISDIKDQNNIIHISEFNKKIAEIVSSEPIPFIYERLGEKYKHFLVDEFQDTSILQWQNLIPLIDNSLSEGNFNMIVGDGKQAIYRWRNGEVEQFDKLPEIYSKHNLPFADEREQNLMRNFEPRVLQNNFRSKREIIEFNNRFFSFASTKLNEDVKGIYKEGNQFYDAENDGGYVQIEFVQKNADVGDDPILNRLVDLVEELKSEGRDLRDIVLLCRTQKEAQKCSDILLQNKIPILSSESLLLSTSAEVNLLISFLKFLIDPTDKIHLATLVQYFINKNIFTSTDLLTIYKSSDRRTQSRIDFTAVFNLFDEKGMSFKLEQLISLPIYDLLEKTIRIFNLNEKVDPYVQFFLDEVLKQTLNGVSNINEIIDWWEIDKEKLSVIVPEGIEAIQVMTIHKSKGLEFPVVIYPYANERHKPGLNQVWVHIDEDEVPELKVANLPFLKYLSETKYSELYEHEMNKSLLDMINLSYVAFTRSIEQLYVISNYPTESKSRKSDDIEKLDLPKLLKSFLENENLWNPEELVYSFGNQMAPASKSIVKDESYKLSEFNSVDWRNNLLISTSAPEIWDMDNPQQNKEWGNLIHYLLSQLVSVEDVLKVSEQAVQNGMLEIDQIDDVVKLMQEIVSHPELTNYFKEGLNIKTESDILLETGLTIRPDRLIIADKHITIIDYKTGRPSENHINQLNNYAQTLMSMGYESIDKVLIYIDGKIRVEKWQ